MNDADIRALQVKMLTDDQLKCLHAAEMAGGSILASSSVTGKFRLQPIKEYYRVTHNAIRRGRVTERVLHEWASTVHGVMERFRREAGLILTANDMINQHNLDRAIWNSDLDFYYKTASVAKRATRWRGQPETP